MPGMLGTFGTQKPGTPNAKWHSPLGTVGPGLHAGHKLGCSFKLPGLIANLVSQFIIKSEPLLVPNLGFKWEHEFEPQLGQQTCVL